MNIIGRCVFDILASLGDADRQTDRRAAKNTIGQLELANKLAGTALGELSITVVALHSLPF